MKREKFAVGTLQVSVFKDRVEIINPDSLPSELSLEEPSFPLEEGFKVTLWRPSSRTIHDTPHDTPHDYINISSLPYRLVFVLEEEMSRIELMDVLDLNDRMHFTKNYIIPAITDGLIEMTLPDKPKSKKQKYRLTTKGQNLQKSLKDRFK